ncbi:MAG: helix-turn-helix domain-containing protein [Rhodospirillales bacterium]|nr:MAG: helix-turn-helix domain-containing protein [Rhodospirillales bacterium]
MAELAYVRARYAANFAVAMQRLGIPLEPVLEKVRLTGAILEDPDSWIAAHQLWELARLAALRSGKLDLGYDAGTVVGTAAHGEFGRLVTSQPTLYQRLQAFCEGARAEYSKADFRIEWKKGTVYFSRWPIEGDDVQRRQVELYVLPMMLDTIRGALGSAWQPRSLSLQSFEGADLESRIGRATAALRWERPVTRIEIGDAGLADSICRALTEQERVSRQARTDGTPPPLSQIVEAHLEDADFSLDALAEMFGTNRRTFQFQLARSGTSFSDLVAEARMRVSARLLMDPAVPIVDIALSLGYSCQSHYTRAFRNWSGTTPLKFRRHALAATSEDIGLPTAVPLPAE